jgi:hypothetical protein
MVRQLLSRRCAKVTASDSFQPCQDRAADRGRHQSPGAALENQLTQLGLGLGELLADGSCRYAELIGCGLQRPQTTHRLDCPQTIQMHEIEVFHIAFLKPNPPFLN